MNRNSTVYLAHPLDRITIVIHEKAKIAGLRKHNIYRGYIKTSLMGHHTYIDKDNYFYSRSWHAWINKKYLGDVLI